MSVKLKQNSIIPSMPKINLTFLGDDVTLFQCSQNYFTRYQVLADSAVVLECVLIYCYCPIYLWINNSVHIAGIHPTLKLNIVSGLRNSRFLKAQIKRGTK